MGLFFLSFSSEYIRTPSLRSRKTIHQTTFFLKLIEEKIKSLCQGTKIFFVYKKDLLNRNLREILKKILTVFSECVYESTRRGETGEILKIPHKFQGILEVDFFLWGRIYHISNIVKSFIIITLDYIISYITTKKAFYFFIH